VFDVGEFEEFDQILSKTSRIILILFRANT